MNRLVVVLAIASCGKTDRAPSQDKPTDRGVTAAPTNKLAPDAATPTPTPAPSDEPPDLVATKALADKACPKVAAPYFYRIEKAGRVSYILGSRHLGVSLAKMPKEVTDQLRVAKRVVFETPPGDDAPDQPGDGKSLADQVGPALWARYEKLVGASTASLAEHAKPAVAMLAMMMLYEDKMSALDNEIETLVTDAHIPTGGLETSAFQDKLLNELLDVRMLKAAIAGTPDRSTLEHEAIDDLTEYCAGTDSDPGMDKRTRAQLISGGYTEAEIAKLDEKLIDARNRDWIPKLDPMLSKGNVFVVVGADHLIGPHGVIAMLAAKGFTASRVAAGSIGLEAGTNSPK
jgi:uncharacterized protein